MGLAEGLAAQRQRPRVERLGLAVPALELVEASHVVEAVERVGMGSPRISRRSARACGVERLGLAVPALALVKGPPCC